MLSFIAELATKYASGHPRILDLGSGPGDVTAGILALVPHARACLMDVSDEMIRISRDRFRGNENIRIARHNLNDDLLAAMPERDFDAVVSCLAIHHIAFDKRVGLYASIREILKPDGVFINCDEFRSESSVVDQWEIDSWIEGIASRVKEQQKIDMPFDEVRKTTLALSQKMEDKPGTIWEMQRDMREAGFVSVDCVWKYLNFAILIAEKQA